MQIYFLSCFIISQLPILRLLIEILFFRTCKLVTETFQSKSVLNYFVPHIYQVLRKCHRFGVPRNCYCAIHISVVSTDIIWVSVFAVRYANHCTTQLPKSIEYICVNKILIFFIILYSLLLLLYYYLLYMLLGI